MRSITQQELEVLTDRADALSSPRGYDKVLRRSDGTIIKFFTRRGWLSTSRLRPHAVRFLRAAQRLQALDIPCVHVVDHFHIHATNRDGVIYQHMDGEALRTRFSTPPLDRPTFEQLMMRLARFMANLHDKGVYFRGLHMGNVIVCPDGRFGLIDFADCSFRRRPLSCSLRVRNFRPLFSYQIDREATLAFGLHRFIDCYLDASTCRDANEARLRNGAASHLKSDVRPRRDVLTLALDDASSSMATDLATR